MFWDGLLYGNRELKKYYIKTNLGKFQVRNSRLLSQAHHVLLWPLALYHFHANIPQVVLWSHQKDERYMIGNHPCPQSLNRAPQASHKTAQRTKVTKLSPTCIAGLLPTFTETRTVTNDCCFKPWNFWVILSCSKN